MKKRSIRKLTASALGVVAAGLASGAWATTLYDLTQVGSSATINGAIFTNPDNDTIVGTGVFDPFVRIEKTGSGNCDSPCVERGYNTDGQPQFDTKAQQPGTNWVHSLLISDISTVEIDGTVYREFFLDVNEANGGNPNDRYLSLDEFILFLGPVGNLDNYDEAANTLKSGDGTITATKIYDMDGAGDSAIGLDYDNFSGSGKGIDMVARVPDSLFTAPGSPQYVYLFSKFGGVGEVQASNTNHRPGLLSQRDVDSLTTTGTLPPGNYGASSGFEEWSTQQVPEPPAVALVGLGLLALYGISRFGKGNCSPMV